MSALSHQTVFFILLCLPLWACCSTDPPIKQEQPPAAAALNPVRAAAQARAPLPRRSLTALEQHRPFAGIENQPTSLKTCIPVEGKASIVGLGSSTMASWLGPALRRMLKGHDMRFNIKGVASTGLARPDFFDWPRQIPGLNRRYNPDIFVVAMGTNDFQSMKHGRKWVRDTNPQWAAIYGERVDRMLAEMSGPNRRRTIIWVGPTAFPRPNSRRFGPKISAIIKARIEAFAGPAYFIDAFAQTSDKTHSALDYLRVPGVDRRIKVRGRDNVHLTHEATRVVMVEPVMQLLKACWYQLQ